MPDEQWDGNFADTWDGYRSRYGEAFAPQHQRTTDTWLSGGGVQSDLALPAGTRVRMRAGATAAHDVDVYVGEDGRVHVVGHYSTVHAERADPNHVVLHAVRPGR
jgi:hypothetical protein